MKISIKRLWSLLCLLVLLTVDVSSANSPPTLTAGMIGKVTYLLGQADVTLADGSVLPLRVQMEIPDASRITVKGRSRVSLLMVDGGIEKLGANTVFIFDKYHYDPDNPEATEIRKTLLDGEVTSTTGRGGEDAKERYRMNSPLAAIAVLGTEYSVKVSRGETWVTVLSGEISIAKLGGSCQRSGLGACVGGKRLSEGQRGLAFVVRASEPKPILMPVTAVPVSEKAAEKPVETSQASAKEAEKEPAKDVANEPEKPQQAVTEKPAEPEPPNSSQVTTAAASTAQQNNTKPQDNTNNSAAVTAAPEPEYSATAVTAAATSPAVEKTNLPATNTSSAPVIETSPTTAEIQIEPNTSAISVPAQAPLDIEFVAVTAPEQHTQALPSVALESKVSALTVSAESPQPPPETPVSSNTKPKQILVQSNNKTVVPSASDKVNVSVTPTVVTTPAVTAAPAKPAVTPVVAAPPIVTPSAEEKIKVETAVALVPAKIIVTPPVVVSEPPAVPIVNWGKYDPVASVDGKTSFSEQVSSSYTQLIQPVGAVPVEPVPQQTPSVSLSEPDPDQPDVGVSNDDAVGDDTVAEAPASVASSSATPVTETEPLSLPNDSVVVTPSSPAESLTVAEPSLPVAPVTVAEPSLPVTITTPSLPAEILAPAPLTLMPPTVNP